MTHPNPLNSPNLQAFAKPFFFISYNRNAEIVFLSPSVEGVLGFAPRTMLGRRLVDFIDASCPVNQNFDECMRERFVENADHNRMDLRVVFDHTGKRRILSVQSYGERDAAGRVIINHCIAQDVTRPYLIDTENLNRFEKLHQVELKLSQREKDVLTRVLDGRLNKSIARELDVSERTVESARSRLMNKYSAETTAHLIRLATEYRMFREMLRTIQRPMVPSPHFSLRNEINGNPIVATNETVR